MTRQRTIWFGTALSRPSSSRWSPSPPGPRDPPKRSIWGSRIRQLPNDLGLWRAAHRRSGRVLTHSMRTNEATSRLNEAVQSPEPPRGGSGGDDMSGPRPQNPPMTRVSSPDLVGREFELGALAAALLAALGGAPSTLVVGGEAGVGKTRLLSEFARRARESGAVVLTGGWL